MANNRIPDERNRQVQEPNLGGIDRGGGWVGWWWVWFFIIIVAAFWFAGWGWGGYGGWWWGRRPAVAEVSPNSTLTGSGVAIMDAPDKAVYAGQPFQLSNVPVQKEVSKQAMWVGTRSSGPMLVVASGTEAANAAPATAENNTAQNKKAHNAGKNKTNTAANASGTTNNSVSGSSAGNTTSALTVIPANIKQGDRVQVSGTVEKAPPANVAQQNWGLSADGVQRLEKQGAYIQLAQVIKQANPPQR